MTGLEGLATRERLVRAAANLLWERSYTAAGVDEICRLSGTRKGSFYHYFKTKADLAVAAIEYQWASFRADVFEPVASTGTPGLDRFRRLVDRVNALQWQPQSEDRALLGCPFGSLGQEMAHQDERIRAAVQTVFDGHCHYLQAWLDEAVRARQVVPGDTALRARQIFALFEGALLLAKVAQDPEFLPRMCAAIPAIAGRTTASEPHRSAAMPELL